MVQFGGFLEALGTFYPFPWGLLSSSMTFLTSGFVTFPYCVAGGWLLWFWVEGYGLAV